MQRTHVVNQSQMLSLSHPLVLASNSPRRKQLLAEAGFVFSVKTADVAEDFPSDMPVTDVPVYLAKRKAQAIAAQLPDAIILGADTVVIIEGEILNKPVDKADASRMLAQLSGKKHDVITGVCLRQGSTLVSFADRTEVYFKSLSQEEITFYVDNYVPLDKAGAYGAQEWMGMVAVEKIIGSYFNVMGLPVHLLYKYLQETFAE